MDTEKNIEYFKGKLKALPLYPRTAPPYRVHWNWDISFRCNYACSYCEVVQREKEFSYEIVPLGKWRDVWERIFSLYWSSHVRFSGGEPTIYPAFWDLVAMLLEKNTVDITTNLSFDLKEMLDKVPPGGLSISSSFHPEFGDMKKFFAKVKYLHFNGFPSTISYVGYPPHLEAIAEYKKMVESEGMYFKIIPFCGTYKEKPYPLSYTPEEKLLLEGFTKDSKDQHLNDMNSQWYDWRVKKESCEPKSKIKKGALCRMGQMYAKIHPDGTVTRCCAGFHGRDSGALGSIADPGFRLLDDPVPCEVGYQCPCFKGMVVGQEEDKWLPLWEALENPVYRTEYMKEYCEYLERHAKGK